MAVKHVGIRESISNLLLIERIKALSRRGETFLASIQIEVIVRNNSASALIESFI